jgi:hypothetical protein
MCPFHFVFAIQFSAWQVVASVGHPFYRSSALLSLCSSAASPHAASNVGVYIVSLTPFFAKSHTTRISSLPFGTGKRGTVVTQCPANNVPAAQELLQFFRIFLFYPFLMYGYLRKLQSGSRSLCVKTRRSVSSFIRPKSRPPPEKESASVLPGPPI